MSRNPFCKILLSCFVFVVISINAFGQNLQWAKQIGGAGWDEGTALITDQNNNLYVAGLFIGTVDFDPGIGVYNLTSVGEKDAFVCKLDPDGNLLWAKQYGDSASIDEQSSIGIDAQGNLYITNSFLGTADFDPGLGTFIMASIGTDRNIFVQKLDTDGNFIWAKQIGAPFNPAFPTPSHSYAISVDTAGNIFLTGYFDGTADFDPHPVSTYTMTAQTGASDIFICKLDSSGNFGWAKQFSGVIALGGVGYSIALDDDGNVYTTGTIGGTVDFDPGPGTFYLGVSVAFQSEIFVSKLDSLGNFVFAAAMGPGDGAAIIADENGNSYSCGWAPLGYTPAVTKLDATGNLIWSKQLGGSYGNSLALDSNGNIYTTGICYGTNDFDPGPGVFSLTGGITDAYISVLDSAGNFLWAGLFTGNEQVWVNTITIDNNNNIYTTGFFNGTADFDPSSAVFNLVSPAIGYDIFINKLALNITSGLGQNNLAKNINVYPNPTEENLIIEFDEEQEELQLILRNTLGQIVQTESVNANRRIELKVNEESGIYFLEIIDQKQQRSVMKIVKK
jgi:hypothetical protein